MSDLEITLTSRLTQSFGTGPLSHLGPAYRFCFRGFAPGELLQLRGSVLDFRLTEERRPRYRLIFYKAECELPKEQGSGGLRGLDFGPEGQSGFA